MTDEELDGMVLPGGESTAMGLIGTSRTNGETVWDALRNFIREQKKPTWGTCAGMILMAERCVGASSVIQDGQALIGGMDVLVCRNYFGSQVSSFEMEISPPPSSTNDSDENISSYPGVFIRAPAILSAGPDVKVLGKVIATPCRQAAIVLQELERKIEGKESSIHIGVENALEMRENDETMIQLPGTANGSNAREVICAVQKDNLLCTAFHPELTDDLRWHKYFAGMVCESMTQVNVKNDDQI